MAAADYFAGGTRPSAAYLAPPQPGRTSSNPNVNFTAPQPYAQIPAFPSPQPRPTTPQSHHPPPPYHSPSYGDEKPSVHFAPPPVELPGRASFSGQRPYPPQWNPQYQPPQPGPPVRYNPQAYAYQHPPPHLRPYTNNNYSESSLMSGYSSDPEPHRRRHKNSEKKKRRISESSRSTATDGIIGATGGGLIGDLIFPGLGTAAGALAGWIGGRDYGQHRKWREEKRDKSQEEWERRHSSRDQSSDGRRRNRDHSSDGRRKSRDHSSDGGRRRSHDDRRRDY